MGTPAWLAVLEELAPAILASAGVPVALIPVVKNGIAIAETIHDQKGFGQQKLQFVQTIANTAIDGIVAAKPDLLNGPSAKVAVAQGISATVAAVNARHASGAPDAPQQNSTAAGAGS